MRGYVAIKHYTTKYIEHLIQNLPWLFDVFQYNSHAIVNHAKVL